MLLPLAVIALLVHGATFPDSLSDDAFISFRYADNLVKGHGLVYNPGEAPVEGYTNFLWTVLLAAGIALGFDPEPTARWLGLACAAGAQIATFALSRRALPHAPALWTLPAWLLALDSFFVVEAVQGLETVLLAALTAAAVAATPGDLPPPSSAGRATTAAVPWSAVWLGLAALTRPEGLLFFAVLAALRSAELLGSRRAPGRRDLLWAAVFAVPVAAHLAFRRLYYSDWLPNTFHAKTGGGWEQLRRGIDYVLAGWWPHALWLVLAALLLLPAVRPRDSASGGGRPLLAAAAVWLASTVGVAAVGGDFKPTFRFLVWTLPLLAVLTTAGLASALARLPRPARRASGLRTAAAGLAVALLLAATFLPSQPARGFAAQRRDDLRVLRQAARWFGDHLPADAVIATGPAGAIPYYTGLRTVDMWGINDRGIGRRQMPAMGSGPAGHEKGDGAAVLARAPDVVLFTDARFTPAPLPETALRQVYLYVSERELLALPEFRRLYRWRSVRLPAVYMNFFERTAEVPA